MPQLISLITLLVAVGAAGGVFAANPVARLELLSGDRQILVGIPGVNAPFGVRAVDLAGEPVQDIPIVIGPVTPIEPGAFLADEFGFRGFNAPPVDYIYYGNETGSPGYFGRTLADGSLHRQSIVIGPAPSASPIGAMVVEGGLRSKTVAPVFFTAVRVETQPQGAPTVAVEFFNATVGHYFLTQLQNEIELLDAGAFAGWKRSVGAMVVWATAADAPAGAVPVCRFFSSTFTSHFYTADPAECDTVIARWPDVWTLETREAFYIHVPDKATGTCGAGLQPVYRMYNNRPAPNHRYITDRNLRDTMIAHGWLAEGYGPEAVMFCTAG